MEEELKVYNELNAEIYNQTTDLLAKSKNQPFSSNQSTAAVEETEQESNIGSESLFVENGVC